MVSYVRIFKLIAMILIANIIWAQNSAETLMHNLESSGRWGDYYVLDSKRNFNLVTRDLTVDSLYFIGDKSIHDVALSNLFGNVKGSPSKNIAISRFLDIVYANKFISNSSSIDFAKYNKHRVAAVVNVKNDFKSHIGGNIGSNRDESGDWKINGQLDLRLENLLKNASRVQLKWQQPSQSFRYLHFEIGLPVFLNMPFGMQVNTVSEFFDKNYVKRILKGYMTKAGSYGKWRIGSKIERVKDLSSSEKSITKALSLGIDGDRRNNRWIPFSGRHWDFEFDLGSYRDDSGESFEINSNATMGFYKNIFSGSVYVKTHGAINRIQKRRLTQSKKILFGGTNNFRGYIENQFASDWFIINTLENIYYNRNSAQLFIFIDHLIADDIKLNPTTGFGIRVFNGSIFYNIILAFPESNIMNGKLHLKFSTSL